MRVLVAAAGVLFIGLYIFSLVYLGRRIQEGFQMILPDKFKWCFYAIYIVLALSMFLGRIPISYTLKSLFNTVGAYFMGFYAYGLMLFLLRDLVFRLMRAAKILEENPDHRILGVSSLLLLAAALMLMFYGTYHANQIKVVSYEVDTRNQALTRDLRIVLISDLHLGAVGGEKRLPEIVRTVKAQDPDLILIAGDFFDDDFTLIRNPEKVKELLQSMNSTYGTFASLGNHDAGKTLPDMLAFLEECGVSVLMEEYQIKENSFVVLGRLDPSPIGGFGDKKRKETQEVLSTLPSHLPVIVMDHTPKEVEKYGDGVDLVVSGHTHKGQIFPFQVATDLLFTVDYGYYRKEEKGPGYIVTSGAGTWGPPMRVGTNSEVVLIKLNRVK